MEYELAALVPGTWHVVLDELSPDDPAYPNGQSLTAVRAMIGGSDAGTLQSPTGVAMPVSLRFWQGHDPDTTRLRLSLMFTPDQPIARDDPRYPPPPTATRDVFRVVDDRASHHRVEVRPVSAHQPPITAGNFHQHQDLTAAVLRCPLCDAPIALDASLGDLVRSFADEIDGDETPIDICVYHPNTIPETAVPPPGSPIRVARTWRA